MKKFYVLWGNKQLSDKNEPVFYAGFGEWLELEHAHIYTEEQVAMASSVPFTGKFIQLPSK